MTRSPETSGFIERSRAESLLPQVTSHPVGASHADALAHDILASPDPDNALLYCAQLIVDAELPETARTELQAVLAHDDVRRALVTLFAASPFLARSVLQAPGKRLPLIAPALSGPPSTDAVEDVSAIASADALKTHLRHRARDAFLAIAVRDVMQRAALLDTTAALSHVAVAAVGAAHDWNAHDLARTITRHPPALAVLGMGKLGGEELNYSSDIDLVYFFAPDVEPLGALKLAEALTATLSEATADGIVFRVDLRLRPEGSRGPVAITVPAAVEYYQTWGRPWEQAALIKARAIAGDTRAGDNFITEISPFVYRRYLDYMYVEDMKSMKADIDREATRRRAFARDVKLGRGGIREIEFFVSTFQLIHGGRIPDLRTRSTLDALDGLVAQGLVADETAEDLRVGYDYLRRVEHMIQLAEFRQTQIVPTDMQALARIAALMGETGPHEERAQKFLDTLDAHRSAVSEVFEKLFYEPSREVEAAAPEDLADVANGDVAHEDAVDILRQHGFSDPAHAYNLITVIREGDHPAPRSRATRALVTKLLPLVVSEIAQSPNPDRALRATDAFLARTGSRAPTLALLAENPATARFLFRLFGSSEYLSAFFLAHPELLDSLVRLGGGVFDAEKLAHELTEVLHPERREPLEYEDMLDTLRRFLFEKTLVLGLSDLEGERDVRAVQTGLTALADAIVAEALREALATLTARHGTPHTEDGARAHMVAVGMGSYGSGELVYASDLDLIFVYSGAGETDGARPISNAEFFAKAAQRMISTLTVQTAQGKCFEVDMRLRPSGNAGPLVTSVAAFREYHDTSAAVWERMALTRARVVAGDEELAHTFARDIAEIPYKLALPENAAEEMQRLRARMVEELADTQPGHYDIKLGPGGLTDVEFIVQFQALRHHPERPSPPHTLDVLAAMPEHIDETDAVTLARAYHVYAKLLARLRMVLNAPTTTVVVGHEDPGAPAARAAAELLSAIAPDAGADETPRDILRGILDDTRAAVRACYARYVA